MAIRAETLDINKQLFSARVSYDFDNFRNLYLLLNHRPLVIEDICKSDLASHGITRVKANSFAS